MDKDTISVNAKIEKLWTYLTLGAVKVGLNADISTTLSVNNKELNTVVKRKEEYLLVKIKMTMQISSKALWLNTKRSLQSR